MLHCTSWTNVHSLSCSDLLDVVILNPLEMVADAVASISDIPKVILSSVPGMFKGIEGTCETLDRDSCSSVSLHNHTLHTKTTVHILVIPETEIQSTNQSIPVINIPDTISISVHMV